MAHGNKPQAAEWIARLFESYEVLISLIQILNTYNKD
jgi:hypothetical protein